MKNFFWQLFAVSFLIALMFWSLACWIAIDVEKMILGTEHVKNHLNKGKRLFKWE